MKDLGPLHYFLRIEVNRSNGEMFLSQTRYIVDLLNRANMLGAKPVSSHPRDSYLAQSYYWRPTSRSHTVLQSYWSIPITYINKARHFICHKSSMPIHAYPHQWTHVFSQTDAPLPQRYNTVWTPSPTRPTATHCILWCWLGWWSQRNTTLPVATMSILVKIPSHGVLKSNPQYVSIHQPNLSIGVSHSLLQWFLAFDYFSKIWEYIFVLSHSYGSIILVQSL